MTATTTERYPILDTAPGLTVEQVFAEPGAAPACPLCEAERRYAAFWYAIAGSKSRQVKHLKAKIKRMRGLIHTETALVEAERDAWKGRCEAAREELAAEQARRAREFVVFQLADPGVEARQLRAENAQIRRELDELERQNAALRGNNDSLSTMLGQWIDRCTNAEEHNHELVIARDTALWSLETAEKALTEARKDLADAENNNLILLRECQFKDRKIEQMRRQLNDCASDYTSMAKENRRLGRLVRYGGVWKRAAKAWRAQAENYKEAFHQSEQSLMGCASELAEARSDLRNERIVKGKWQSLAHRLGAEKDAAREFARKAADDAIAQRDQFAAILREMMDIDAAIPPCLHERAQAALLSL